MLPTSVFGVDRIVKKEFPTSEDKQVRTWLNNSNCTSLLTKGGVLHFSWVFRDTMWLAHVRTGLCTQTYAGIYRH